MGGYSMARSPEPAEIEPEAGKDALRLCACHLRRAISSASGSVGARSDRRRFMSGSSFSGPRLKDPDREDGNPPDESRRSSGAHHPGPSPTDDANDEKRDVRDVGESSGEVAECMLGENDGAKGDTRGGWSVALRRALMPGKLTFPSLLLRSGGRSSRIRRSGCRGPSSSGASSSAVISIGSNREPRRIIGARAPGGGGPVSWKEKEDWLKTWRGCAAAVGAVVEAGGPRGC